MLEKTSRLRLDQLSYHVAQHSADRIETLICCANIVEAIVIKKNLLHNEDGHGLAKLRARLHDSEAKWDNLRCEEKINHLG